MTFRQARLVEALVQKIVMATTVVIAVFLSRMVSRIPNSDCYVLCWNTEGLPYAVIGWAGAVLLISVAEYRRWQAREADILRRAVEAGRDGRG